MRARRAVGVLSAGVVPLRPSGRDRFRARPPSRAGSSMCSLRGRTSIRPPGCARRRYCWRRGDGLLECLLLCSQLNPHVRHHHAYFGDSVFQLLLRHSQFHCPISQLVRLMNVDARPVCRAALGRIVTHLCNGSTNARSPQRVKLHGIAYVPRSRRTNLAGSLVSTARRRRPGNPCPLPSSCGIAPA
jgi:hypothetical protein